MEDFEPHILPFLENDQFISWITQPDDVNNAYWARWMQEHPDQTGDLLQARDLAIRLRDTQKTAGTEQITESIFENIHARISQTSRRTQDRFVMKPAYYWAAASVAGLLILLSALFHRSDITLTHNLAHQTPPKKVGAVLENNTLSRANSSGENQVAYLVDGTKVTLLPGSSISYSIFFQKDKREVTLNGDAFFDVAKDAGRPFYVYTNDIVLRVLGTSFHVSKNKDNGNITVMVKTGKVSVYNNNANSNKSEYILNPNQGIVYIPQFRRMVKSNLDSSGLRQNLVPESRPINFKFDETPVADIFASLQDGYGIKINFDQQVFARCLVTTSLTDESFEEKLKIICHAISAEYKISGNQVFVNGRGCE